VRRPPGRATSVGKKSSDGAGFIRRHRHSSVRQAGMTVKILLTLTAAIETGAGLALLGLPSVTASLLLGSALQTSAAVSLARIGGAAILALAIVCWQMRNAHGVVSRGLVVAMLFYNVAVAAVLAFADFGHGLNGMLLWPAIAFHLTMGVWCTATLSRNDDQALQP
jgi:hypothetical protein